MRRIGSEVLSIDSAFVEELWRENAELDTRHLYRRRIYDPASGQTQWCATGGGSNPVASIRASTVKDQGRVLDIWRKAVDATHDFLTTADRREIEHEVITFLPHVPLWLAVDASDCALGFMFLEADRMEALFIHPLYRGSGIGRHLVQHALTFNEAISTDVNEQNLQAVGFYRHLGFERTGYSTRDQQGRPYPLIHLRKSRETIPTK